MAPRTVWLFSSRQRWLQLSVKSHTRTTSYYLVPAGTKRCGYYGGGGGGSDEISATPDRVRIEAWARRSTCWICFSPERDGEDEEEEEEDGGMDDQQQEGEG